MEDKLKVSLSEDVRAVYANLVLITDNGVEFVLDFGEALPGAKVGRVLARIVMVPVNAKRLAEALQRHVAAFEEKYGEVRPPEGPTHADALGLLYRA